MSDVNDDLTVEAIAEAAPPVLRRIDDFGPNPGNLGMKLCVPHAAAGRSRPLVVVLHGCTQTPEGYDAASGWSKLAAAHDFLVLYAEQRRDNNQQTCFSWFEPEDTQRDRGEARSIVSMIETAIVAFGADPRFVFICGLSAGGAMANAMLATYPELFRAGAIIAGLPYGAAGTVMEAYESMSSGRVKEAKAWGDLVRDACDHQGRWPSVAIWHGTADTVVRPINAGELVKQWTNVHGLGADVPAEDHVGAITRRTWGGPRREPVVTEYSVPGLGHGAPIDADEPPAPFFLPAGVSSTAQIADDWGLTDRRARPAALPRSLRAIFGVGA